MYVSSLAKEFNVTKPTVSDAINYYSIKYTWRNIYLQLIIADSIYYFLLKEKDC